MSSQVTYSAVKMRELLDQIKKASSASLVCSLLELYDNPPFAMHRSDHPVDLENEPWSMRGVDAGNEMVKAVHVDGNAIVYADGMDPWTYCPVEEIWLKYFGVDSVEYLADEQMEQYFAWESSLRKQQTAFAGR